MLPLDRELRRRRRLAGRLSAVVLAVLVGSAGTLAPGLGEQQELRARLAEASERAGQLLAVQADVRRFEREGLPRLEAALDEMRRRAPPDPLPPGTRAAWKERLERAGASVENVQVGERGPCPGLAGDDEFAQEEDESDALWEATPLTVTGHCAWEDLEAVLRAATGGERWVLLREVRCERGDPPVGSVRFTFEVACLHFTEPEPWSSPEDWDEEAFSIEEDEP